MNSTAYLVVMFFGNKDPLSCQKLDRVFFTEDAANKRAKAMQTRHKWIWRVIPIEVPISTTQEAIRAEAAERGIKL